MSTPNSRALETDSWYADSGTVVTETCLSTQRNDDVPPLIAGELDDIASASDHGTVVILPAFNSFREGNRSVGDMVLEAAASNFFVAIQEGRLEIWVEDDEADTKELILDASTLPSQLANNREKKRSRAFLSGARAHDAHQAFLKGRPAVVNTSQGDVHIRLYQSAETTRIDLCRNGMWITDDKGISSFYYKFADRMPFHAVLLLDAGPRIHSLVRDAEGPLHDTIRLKDLSRGDKRDLQSAFAEIREWILDNTEQIRGDSFGVEDFLGPRCRRGEPEFGWQQCPFLPGHPVVVQAANPDVVLDCEWRRKTDSPARRGYRQDQPGPSTARPGVKPGLPGCFSAFGTEPTADPT